MKRKYLFTCCLLLIINYGFTQNTNTLKCYPANWWAGMKMNKIQLMLHSGDTNIILAVDKLVVKSSSQVN